MDENRVYRSWNTNSKVCAGFINQNTGIIEGKYALNKLHVQLSGGGFEQVQCVYYIVGWGWSAVNCEETDLNFILVEFLYFNFSLSDCFILF